LVSFKFPVDLTPAVSAPGAARVCHNETIVKGHFRDENAVRVTRSAEQFRPSRLFASVAKNEVRESG
jgi:hypothetical protein